MVKRMFADSAILLFESRNHKPEKALINCACTDNPKFDIMRSRNERINYMLTDEYRYKILKLVSENPEISQRKLAKHLDISLGKANFCLKALIDVGLVKATNFHNSKNKLAYMYLLTPSGVEEKANITVRFLKHKLKEYEALQLEIDGLRREAVPALYSEHQNSKED